MTSMRDNLIKAIESEDLSLIDKILQNGADINAQNDFGESILSDAVFILADSPNRYNVVKFLLEKGADPKVLDSERVGCLQNAMLGMDTKMLELLLDFGADPNAEAGFTDSETLYDWAEEDYRYETYDFHLPEDPTEEDKANEESWLKFLQRLAQKYGRREPDHLFLLRARGARGASEL